jgi:hypothetical protein
VDRRTFLQYQTKTWLPYFIRRYFLFRRDTPEPPALIETSEHLEEKRCGAKEDGRSGGGGDSSNDQVEACTRT